MHYFAEPKHQDYFDILKAEFKLHAPQRDKKKRNLELRFEN